jgi:saccharopine dehydrogenase (NADP+, L-glutamate forming)
MLTGRYAAVKQVLDGTISEKGILAPMTPRINNPLMKELKEKYGSVLLAFFSDIWTDK